MKHHTSTFRIALLTCVLAPCLTSAQAQQKTPATTAQKMSALQSLRDSGVLTEAEYQQKVAALKPSASRSGTSTAADGHTWHLKREERSAPLTDWETGQTRTFKMLTMLVPEGWTMQPSMGDNFAKVDCADMSGRLQIAAMNADKSIGVLIIPTEASMWAANQGLLQQKMQMLHDFRSGFSCSIEQPEPLAQKMQQGATMLVPGARIVGGMEPVPGLSAELPAIVAAANRNGSHVTAEAGRLRLNGSLQGQQREMWLVSMLTERTESGPGGSVTYNDLPMVALLFAPPGQLDANDKLLMTVLSSVEISPEWTHNNQLFVAKTYEKINGAYATVNRIHQEMQQDNANAARQQQAIRTNSANYANQVHSAVAANRSAALDHSSQQFSLYMGDQAIYKDPSTGQNVQMSSQYGHVWASSTGNTNDYIMTDSPSYDPNGKVGSSGWTEMQMQH
jgi:hypothetical protein